LRETFPRFTFAIESSFTSLKKVTSFSGEFDVFETFIKAFSACFFQCTIFWLVVEGFSMFVAEGKIDFETPT
jgi:hypothetical protein